MKLFFKQLHKKKNGFTMMELLMVIAIIVILIGVSIPAVGLLRRNLRQRELDSKAEVIYMAAQSRLTQLRTGGFAELYGGQATDAMPDISKADAGAVVRGIEGLHKDILPSDAINDNGEAQNLCYVVSEEGKDVAYVLLPEESVDKDLWNGSWIIEFDPEVGTVYAVFYSRESILDRTSSPNTITDALNDLRSKNNRLSDGARVGYYGGDLTQISVVDKKSMTTTLKIINQEKLIAEITCTTAEMPEMKLTITDTAGHRYVKTVSQADIKQPRAGTFQASLVLDSLDSPSSSFYAQTEGKLLCGTDITVRVDTSRDMGNSTSLTDYDEQVTNSLFAYRGDYSGTADTAYIAYGRHLQNLDNNTSHVLNTVGGVQSNVTKAVQVSDVSFLESTKADSYYAAYGDRLFTPIHNSQIVSYMGQGIGTDSVPAIIGLHVESSEPNVGLFTTFAGTFRDLRITGPKIYGGTSNVGTLMGAVSGTRATEITNVQVFLSDLNGDLENKADTVEGVKAWLKGRNVGGLIGSAGSNKLTILNSSASLPMEADRYVGGLVGMLNCNTIVQNSYADGYLRGAYVGGLIGGAGQRASIILSDFYAVGYGVATQQAAGLVVFNKDYSPLKQTYNGYAAMHLEIKKGNTGEIYATAPKCVSASHTYYMPQNGVRYADSETPDIEPMAYEILSGKGAFGYETKDDDGETKTVYRLLAPFKLGADATSTTYPYNLMRQGLTTYTFPKLNANGQDLAHYGDWAAEFEEGSLVYFERDERGKYRFEGGNISVDEIGADTTESDYTKRHKIVADGYALAYGSDKGTEWDGTATLNGKTIKLKDQEKLTVANYHLYRIPVDLLNDEQAAKSSDTFYRALTVTENGETKTFYFNPAFASCFGNSQDAKPTILRIRSPRQLYLLSRLYETYWQKSLVTSQMIFRQEMDLDYSIYEWSSAYKANTQISTQEPIGTEANAFYATYDGRYNTIQGLSISTKGSQVGLFGKVETLGTVQNLVLFGEKTESGFFGYLTHSPSAGQDTLSVADGIKTVNLGALVGWNKGTISNCAVTGYRISLAAYNGVTVNIGGLVGRNEGGSISGSSAETPDISVRNYASNTYAAGFVGYNSGSVYNCYAAGYVKVIEAKLETSKNTSRVAGFAGRNDSGNLVRCYAGTPLMGSGDTEIYGFVPTGGSVLSCYYLDGGTYEYRGEIYSLNASENAQSKNNKGVAVDADRLKAHAGSLSGYAQAQETYLGNEGKDYPYPEAVTRYGRYLHFGQWPNQDKDVGEFGVFYWEYEEGGNSGYHFTFQGTSKGQVMDRGGTLCTAHDDGGVITKYGYGYFYKPTANLAAGEKDPQKPTLVTQYCNRLKDTDGNVYTLDEWSKKDPKQVDAPVEPDAAASRELQKQMPQYTFVAYRTDIQDKGLHMGGEDVYRKDGGENNRNATWRLCLPYKTQTVNGQQVLDETASGVYTYSVSPFFGDAYELTKISLADSDMTRQVENITLGAKDRSYQVRSIDQLQYINWNYALSSLTAKSYLSTGDSNNDGYHSRYPYLSYGKPNVAPTPAQDLYWVQTHDLEGKNYKGYVPIGSMNDNAGNTSSASATMAFFASSYDGQAYAIRNLTIDINAQCVGIFGVTSGAKLRNITLYSDTGAQIIHRDCRSWYAVGGIVGLAGSANNPDSYFENCTVSGYSILDVQTNNPGWAGGCVGGLVGATTMNLTNCTAVTDIDIQIGYNSSWQNIRVGGLVGSARGTIESCYAGGSMKNSSTTIKHNGIGSGTSIWMGGILGGIILRNTGNLANLVGDTTVVTHVRNSYSYVQMPESGTYGLKGSYAIASNGEMQESFDSVVNDYVVIENCYALDSAVQNTDDYKLVTAGDLKDTQTFRGVNLNKTNYVSGTNQSRGSASKSNWDWWDRRVQLDNDRTPYIGYQEMQTKMLGWLNDNITVSRKQFGTVTVTENSASINGKYSFPGGDKQLVGLDYPFPTILNQKTVAGETVNVHYGAWPKFGIYWKEHKATMDLIANRNTSGVNLLALYRGQEDEASPVPAETAVPETTVSETTVPETTVPETTVPDTTVSETAVSEAAAQEAEAPRPVVLETAAAPAAQPETPPSAQPEESPVEGETEETVTLDAAFQSLDANALQATLDYELYVVGIDTEGISPPEYQLQDETGADIEKVDEDKAAAVILNADDDLDGDHFNITFLGQHPGTVRILATVQKDGTPYRALLTLTVTADLKIAVSEEDLPLKTYVGDAMEPLLVTLEDVDGNQFKPGENAGLEWSLVIDSQESEQDLVNWGSPFINEMDVPIAGSDQTEKALFLTTLKGFSAGEGSLKLSLKYTWDKTQGAEAETIESSVIIPVQVLPSDVLGLGDGVIAKEVELPHTPPATGSFTGSDRTDEENTPALDGQSLFLYASKDTDSYTDLTQFQVTKAELKWNGGYRVMEKVEPEEGEQEPTTDAFTFQADEEHRIRFDISKAVDASGTGNQRFAYRTVTVSGDQDPQWILRLTLKPVDADRTYVLEYARPNTVTFAYHEETGDTVLEEYRVDQGKDLNDLDQDTLDQELFNTAQGEGLTPTTKPGYHYTWALPKDAITANRTIVQEEVPIRYYVAYDAGYEDYEWDDNVPMEQDTFTFGTEDKHLKANEYNRPGYEFAGWSGTQDSSVPEFTDSAAFTDEEIFADCGQTEYLHNVTLKLYAVWEPKTYTISYNGNFPDWDGEGKPVMKSDTYGIGHTAGTVKENSFLREGYTFQGWAFDASKEEPDIAEGDTLEKVMHQGGEYVVYSDVTLYAVWQKDPVQEVTNTLDTPEEPEMPIEDTKEAPKEPAKPESEKLPTEPESPEPEDKPADPAPESTPTPEPEEESEEKPKEKETPEEEAPEGEE